MWANSFSTKNGRAVYFILGSGAGARLRTVCKVHHIKSEQPLQASTSPLYYLFLRGLDVPVGVDCNRCLAHETGPVLRYYASLAGDWVNRTEVKGACVAGALARVAGVVVQKS